MYLKAVISENDRLKQVYLNEHTKMMGSAGSKNMKLFNEFQICHADFVMTSNQYKS